MKGLVAVTVALVVVGQVMGLIANNLAKDAGTAVEAVVEHRLDTSAYE